MVWTDEEEPTESDERLQVELYDFWSNLVWTAGVITLLAVGYWLLLQKAPE